MAKKKSRNKNSKTIGGGPANTKRRIITLTSIAIVAIFVVIIVIGLIKDNRSESKSAVPTEDQLALAKTIVSSSLQNSSDSLANYQFIASKKIRLFNYNNGSVELLQVCLSNNATKHIYFIDLRMKQIMMHTQTTIYAANKEFIKYTGEESGCHSRD